MNYFIEDLEKKTGVSKRQVYNLMRRYEFYKKFGVKKMSELPNATNNGSVSKALTQDMFEYLLEKIGNGCHFRAEDTEAESTHQVVYLADLFPGGSFKVGDVEQRRFKLGFTSKDLAKRESDFKVNIPEAKIIKHWRLSSSAERVLMSYVDGNGCERIPNSEIFIVTDFDAFLAKIEEFAENLK
jgi:hypothetical protein